MRPARLRPGPAPLVAVAHGSADPRAAATIGSLMAAVRSRAAASGLAGLDAREAFLGHAVPSVPQVLAALAPEDPEPGGRCVVVPLLLTAAYHSKTDLPAVLAAARRAHPGLAIGYAAALGPHRLLLTALEGRLAEAYAGPRAAASVVLAAAGSSDPAANASVAHLASRLQAAGGWRAVVPAYASAASPSPAEAVRALLSATRGPVVVATYLLAPGYFADKVAVASLEAGATAVSAALGAAPEVAEVVLRRYASAQAQAFPLSAPAPLSATAGAGPGLRGSWAADARLSVTDPCPALHGYRLGRGGQALAE